LLKVTGCVEELAVAMFMAHAACSSLSKDLNVLQHRCEIPPGAGELHG